MSKALIVVETPAKAVAISALAGSEYRVLSTDGPLRDLPANQLGFDPNGAFDPQFEVSESRRAMIEKLAAAARECGSVYLAMDPDLEGEADAWHAREMLTPLLPPKTPIKRARMTELTLRALRQALRYAGVVDMAAVESQKARRALDRLVLRRISPHVWRHVGHGTVIGRIQAIALRLVVARERDRAEVKPLGRWRFAVRATGRAEPETEVFFRLVDNDGQPLVTQDRERAPVIRTALSSALVTVDTVRHETIKDPAPPAYTTETLLEDASAVLGLTPGRTLAVARKLYEGVDFGEGPVGLLTYPVTAESRVAEPARDDALAYIRKRFGANYAASGNDAATVVLGRPEAVRPADVTRTPESLKGKLDAAELQLYMLVWRRFLASQMAPARIKRTIASVDALASGDAAFRLHATAETTVFRGHRLLTDSIVPKPEGPFPPDKPAARIPPLTPGEALTNLGCTEDSAEPSLPARYTESEFVRTLSTSGLGKPATFAALVASLYQRKFVERRNRHLVLTELGSKTLEFLATFFPGLLGPTFAASVESRLDALATGKGTAAELVALYVARFRVWTGEDAEERADPECVETVFSAFDSVVNWATPSGTKLAKGAEAIDPIADQARVKELRKIVREAEDHTLPMDQYEELLKLFFRYRAQIPRYVEYVRKIGRYDLLELPGSAPDTKLIQRKMEWVDKAPLSPESRRFVESLKWQVESCRHLTEAQVRVLDEILAAQALRIEGLTPEILNELGVVPRTQEDIDSIQRLLDALASVKEWRPPSQRGKRTYDDESFTASVRDQFQRRGDLSPAQLAAVRRMVARYHDRIDGYAELAPLYDLPPEGLPQPNFFGRRTKKKAPPKEPDSPK